RAEEEDPAWHTGRPWPQEEDGSGGELCGERRGRAAGRRAARCWGEDPRARPRARRAAVAGRGRGRRGGAQTEEEDEARLARRTRPEDEEHGCGRLFGECRYRREQRPRTAELRLGIRAHVRVGRRPSRDLASATLHARGPNARIFTPWLRPRTHTRSSRWAESNTASA